MAKDAYYFSHDSNARFDPKILKLKCKFGLEGYGFYFSILEIMRDACDYMLNIEEIDALAYELQIEEKKIKSMIEICIEIGLFIQENNKIYSKSFLNRMEDMNLLRAKRQEAGRKGGNAKATLKQNPSKDVATLKQNPSKALALNKKKSKEIKKEETRLEKINNTGTEHKIFKVPSVQEIKEYVLDKGYNINSELFFNHYQSNGWHVGKNKMKDWKAAVRTWEITEKNKPLNKATARY